MTGKLERKIRESVWEWTECGWDHARIGDILAFVTEAEKSFPIKFMWDEVTEDIYGKQHVTKVEMPASAGLPENRANAVIDKKELLDWFIEWFVQ